MFVNVAMCFVGVLSFVAKFRERLDGVQNLPHRATAFLAKVERAFGSLPNLRHAAALP